MTKKNKIKYIDLKIIDYGSAYEKQLDYHDQVLQNKLEGIIMLLEHCPVITIGSNKNKSNLLASEEKLKEAGIALVHSSRGGDITFHGPGQLVCYPVLNLNHFQKDVGLYVYNLEQIIINILKLYGVASSRVPKHRGVFTENKKIASIGIKIKRWVTMHGFSFNVSVDLSYFKYIIACGLQDYPPTSLADITDKKINIDIIKEQLLTEFANIFQTDIEKYS